MTYTTPELLLVGAAQNLVLAASPAAECIAGYDNPQKTLRDEFESW